ncbi:MAG: porin [Halioglobus sp.]
MRTCTSLFLACLLLCLSAPAITGDLPATEESVPVADESDARVATMLDPDTTSSMHDDTTILRNVSTLEDRTGVMFFDALRLWVGGAVQYDYFNFDGIYRHTEGGERDEGGNMRRLEGTLRSSLYEWGEIKVQYDFDSGTFRDFYVRWVSKDPETPWIVTIGNQKEPRSLDQLLGNKFTMAQERSAPAYAFGAERGMGVRLHKAFQVERADRPIDVFDDEAVFVTTSIGLFTEGIEESKDTDLALSGRVTAGRERDGVGIHTGLSLSYREGEFDRISLRPEVHNADRIVLANPQANTSGIVGLEGAYNHGPLHLQAEAYYTRYQGRLDGYGGGGYFQAGWFLTGESRDYNARWGVLAPHTSSGSWSTELFARISHTRGEDDLNGWNDYKSATLGANFYYRKLRVSLNLLYGDAREPINGEEDGMALNVRAQYLF